MKFDRITVQEHVDRFREEIRINAEIPMEKITVKEDKFGILESDTIMETCAGEIFIDPTKNFDPRYYSLEKTVLHELGHRAQEAINPRISKPKIFKGLIGYDPYRANKLKEAYGLMKLVFSGNFWLAHSITEGAAECFALDIFPQFCSISDESRTFIGAMKELRREHHDIRNFLCMSTTISRGYRFFHELHNMAGLDGARHYIKYFSSKNVPTNAELSKPWLYWREKIMKL